MIISELDDITPAVLRVMERTTDPRLREIMVALVRHAHAFVRDVGLTEVEFQRATDALATLGQQTTDRHNEVVLMAGSLGISTLVCALNNGDNRFGLTSASLLGPFWRQNAPFTVNGASIVRSPTPGPALFVTGRVVDRQGRPVSEAEVEIWHSSPVGFYENQDPTQADMNLRGIFLTDADGGFSFRSVKPAGYPIPTSGLVGELLRAQNRHEFRPAHLHALIYKPRFKTISSQVYVRDDEHLESDVQFGVTRALVADYVRHDEPHPSKRDVDPPWYSLDYTFVVEAGEARRPRAPIK